MVVVVVVVTRSLFFVLEFFVSMSDAHDFISITSCTYRKRKSMEPTNEHPRQCHERMKVLFTENRADLIIKDLTRR